MIRKILITLLCGVMIFSITGCVQNKNKFEIGEKSNIEIVEKEVTLSVKENTLTNTGVTLILKNDSNVDVQYGNPYEMEIKKDGEWYKINVELYFTLPAFTLKSKETKEIKLNWENSYGHLAKGKYRIIKGVDIEKEDGTFESFYVSTEFNIE